MKGCKLKVDDCPSDMSLYLCRIIHQGMRGNLSDRMTKKGQRSFGVGFSKLAIRMSCLGYKPKYKRVPNHKYDFLG